MNYVKVPLNVSIADYAPIIGKALSMLSTKGGSVRLEKGTYRVSKPIELPSHTCIIGAGMTETFLELIARAPSFEDKGVLRASKSERISIIDLTVDGSRSVQYENEEYGRSGVYLELVNFAWCRNVRVRNHANHGFYPHGSDGRLLHYAFFEACVAEGNTRDGFKLAGTSYASVFNSISQRNGRYGVSVTGDSVHNMVKANHIFNNGARVKGCGVAVFADNAKQPADTLLFSNLIVNSTKAGICLSSTSDVYVDVSSISNSHDADSYCYKLTNVRGFVETATTCNVMSGMTFFSSMPRSTSASTPSPTPTPTPTSSWSSSPSSSPVRTLEQQTSHSRMGCTTGIAEMNVCCSLECEICGGSRCRDRLSDSACCVDSILDAGLSCAEYNPPCVLNPPISHT